VTLIRIESGDLNKASRVLKEDYYNELEKIAKYLIILKRSEDILRSVFRTFLKDALKYAIIEN
jgi:hypothetical protein